MGKYANLVEIRGQNGGYFGELEQLAGVSGR